MRVALRSLLVCVLCLILGELLLAQYAAAKESVGGKFSGTFVVGCAMVAAPAQDSTSSVVEASRSPSAVRSTDMIRVDLTARVASALSVFGRHVVEGVR